MITRVASRPRLRVQSCRYGQDNGHRLWASLGADREPVGVTLATPPPPPTTGLDWTGAEHWAVQSLPCRICKKATQVRDDQCSPQGQLAIAADLPI